jgi:hypothetical protein
MYDFAPTTALPLAVPACLQPTNRDICMPKVIDSIHLMFFEYIFDGKTRQVDQGNSGL